MSVRVDIGIAQFENVNSLRSYPFEDGCDLSCRDSSEMPAGAIVDAHFVVPCGSPDESSESSSGPEGGAFLPSVRLSSFHMSRHMVSACFVSEGGKTGAALSVTVASENFRPYYPYRLEQLSGTEDAGGVVVFGDLELPDFPRTYFPNCAKIHGGCVSPARPPALRRIVDPRSGESVSGDVGIDFSGHVSTSKSGNLFSLSLEEGSGSELASECAMVSGDDACGATPIRSINGIRPDDDGNIVLWFH